jgi:hypothetical protein
MEVKPNIKFGKLTFLKIAGRASDKHIIWECKCDCGNSHKALASSIRRGHTTQCKDCKNKLLSEKSKTHGMRYSHEYRVWQAIKSRCLNKNSKDYKKYGAIGISMYLPWVNSFEEFYKYVGKSSKELSIDRIDNNKGYEPNNVRWATRSQQQRNKKNSLWLMWGSELMHINDIAKKLGITRGAATMRHKRGKLYE